MELSGSSGSSEVQQESRKRTRDEDAWDSEDTASYTRKKFKADVRPARARVWDPATRRIIVGFLGYKDWLKLIGLDKSTTALVTTSVDASKFWMPYAEHALARLHRLFGELWIHAGIEHHRKDDRHYDFVVYPYYQPLVDGFFTIFVNHAPAHGFERLRWFSTGGGGRVAINCNGHADALTAAREDTTTRKGPARTRDLARKQVSYETSLVFSKIVCEQVKAKATFQRKYLPLDKKFLQFNGNVSEDDSDDDPDAKRDAADAKQHEQDLQEDVVWTAVRSQAIKAPLRWSSDEQVLLSCAACPRDGLREHELYSSLACGKQSVCFECWVAEAKPVDKKKKRKTEIRPQLVPFPKADEGDDEGVF